MLSFRRLTGGGRGFSVSLALWPSRPEPITAFFLKTPWLITQLAEQEPPQTWENAADRVKGDYACLMTAFSDLHQENAPSLALRFVFTLKGLNVSLIFLILDYIAFRHWMKEIIA